MTALRSATLMSTLTLVIGLGMVVTTAWLVALKLGPPTGTGLVLAAYLVGFAEIVVVTLLLSLIGSVRTGRSSPHSLAFSSRHGSALASSRTAPRRSLRESLRGVRDAFRDRFCACWESSSVAGLAYSAALAVFTPPNEWDAMTYHLARAAFWIQQQAVAYVPESPVVMINAYPPNAEIGALFTMLLSGGDRYVGLVQHAALFGDRDRDFRHLEAGRFRPAGGALRRPCAPHDPRRRPPGLPPPQRSRRRLVPWRRRRTSSSERRGRSSRSADLPWRSPSEPSSRR